MRWTIIYKRVCRSAQEILNLGRVHNFTRYFDRNLALPREPIDDNLNCVLVDFGIWDVLQSKVIGKDADFVTGGSNVGTNRILLLLEKFDGRTRLPLEHVP